MLQTSQISHSYKGTQAFAFPEIICQTGQAKLILGQSGVGKTTLLHILGGILAPKNGKVFVNNKDLYALKGHKLDLFRGQNIGIVFQKPHFVASLNASENLLLAQKMSGKKTDAKKVLSLLSALNLEHRAQSKTFKMSQGEQQRLSIARAIINNPGLILADEPTSALDDKNCVEVLQLLDHQAKTLNAALVIVTHDTRLKDYYSDKIELA